MLAGLSSGRLRFLCATLRLLILAELKALRSPWPSWSRPVAEDWSCLPAAPPMGMRRLRSC
jgi:hypothetical protein